MIFSKTILIFKREKANSAKFEILTILFTIVYIYVSTYLRLIYYIWRAENSVLFHLKITRILGPDEINDERFRSGRQDGFGVIGFGFVEPGLWRLTRSCNIGAYAKCLRASSSSSLNLTQVDRVESRWTFGQLASSLVTPTLNLKERRASFWVCLFCSFSSNLRLKIDRDQRSHVPKVTSRLQSTSPSLPSSSLCRYSGWGCRKGLFWISYPD